MPIDDATAHVPYGAARRMHTLREPLSLTPLSGDIDALCDAARYRLPGTDGLALHVYLLEFDVAQFDPNAFALAGIVCPPNVARSVRKRQAEFFFGRLAARLALSAAAASSASEEVMIGSMREPVWPASMIGSISHCGGIAAAVVDRCGQRSGIGIDIEPIATGDACKALLATVVDEQETALLRGLAGDAWSLEMLLTLVFSAKESLFKGAFGVVGRYFDFNAAQLVSVDLSAGRVRLALTGDLCAQFVRGQHIDVGFERLDTDLVLTHFVW